VYIHRGTPECISNMFQKHSLKKKSKSLGHLSALNSQPCSPEVEPKMRNYNISDANGHAGRSRFESVQPAAAKYMKRLLSPVSHEREHIRPPPEISSPILTSSVNKNNNKIDKQLQTCKKTTPKKLKGVMKSKGGALPGAGGAMAMGRALIARNFTPQKQNSSYGGRTDGLSDIFGSKENGLIPSKHRLFIMDTQVKYTIGVQMQERNLFLFNDLILIAKERSSSHFKLKDQVPLSNVWLSECISEVSEVTLDPFTSFVIGWPITNAVLTFSTQSEKELWWSKLDELTRMERGHSPAGASINITYADTSTNFQHLKPMYVAITDSSRDCIEKALACLPVTDTTRENGVSEVNGTSADSTADSAVTSSTPMNANSTTEANSASTDEDGVTTTATNSLDPSQYQLWVKTKLDESPYPLIGHEIPLVIKLHWMRQTFNKNQKTYDEQRWQRCRCSFILRKVGQVNNFNQVGSQKKKLKKVKSSIKLQNVFRRVSQGAKGGDSVDGGGGSGSHGNEADDKKPLGKLFGRSLEELCLLQGDTVVLPHPVQRMLVQLDEKGPTTVGIFRRGPNVRAMRDLREKLDQGEDVLWEEISVFVTAALLKDFLRSLPDCVLQCELYSCWSQAGQAGQSGQPTHLAASNIQQVKSYLERLPRVNRYLLHHILYILDKTAQNSQENMMTCSNLSICVGPSLLWTEDSAYMLQQSYTKEVSGLVQLLIENFSTLFGSVPDLLRGDQLPKLLPPAVAASCSSGGGPELMELTHSPVGGGSTGAKPIHIHIKQNKGGLFDHSSLDSLLDPAYPDPADPDASGVGISGGVGGANSGVGANGGMLSSLTNLSHDSGLTTSDSQLYGGLEEAEQDGNDANNHSFSSDDICIETITSSKATVHAFINKKFLAAAARNNSHHGGNGGQGQEHNHLPHGSAGHDGMITAGPAAAGSGSSVNNSPARRKLSHQRSSHHHNSNISSGSNNKHRDRMHRRIHRNNTADYSGSGSFNISSSSTARRSSDVECAVDDCDDEDEDAMLLVAAGAFNYDVRNTGGGGGAIMAGYPLRRTASEESVVVVQQRSTAHQQQSSTSNSFDVVQINNNNHHHHHHSSGSGRRKRPVVHRKGRAPNPPKGSKSASNANAGIIRSNSVNQVRLHNSWLDEDEQVGGVGGMTGGSGGRSGHHRGSADWYRSKSTTRLHLHDDSSDESSSCSTLSDEDSTPHVSRSNSYGRSEDNVNNNTSNSSSNSVIFNTANGQQKILVPGVYNSSPHLTHHHHMLHDDTTTYDIYLHDEHGGTLNISTGHLEENAAAAAAAVVSASRNSAGGKQPSRDFDSFRCETPPGYEESIYRQRLLKLQARPLSCNPTTSSTGNNNSNTSSSGSASSAGGLTYFNSNNSPVNCNSPANRTPTGGSASGVGLPEQVIEKQVELSAKAKAVFEESLRQYNSETTNYHQDTAVSGSHPPPPLPPKTDRPPLPPKQRSRRSTEHESSDDNQTYVNSADLRHSSSNSNSNNSINSSGSNQQRPSRNSTRLSINSSPAAGQLGNSPSTPAVHHSTTGRTSDDQRESSEFVYGSYYHSAQQRGSTKVSVPVIHESPGGTKHPPPSLPPKESGGSSTSAHHQRHSSDSSGATGFSAGGGKPKKRQITSTKIVSTTAGTAAKVKAVMVSVETQTDETDFGLMLSPGCGYPLDDESLFNHTDDSEYSPESNRSISPDYHRPSAITGGGVLTSNPSPFHYPHHLLSQPQSSQQQHQHALRSPDQNQTASDYYLATPANSGTTPLHLYERPVSAQSAVLSGNSSSTPANVGGSGLRHAGRRKLEPVQSVPAIAAAVTQSQRRISTTNSSGSSSNNSDPVIAGEINWSVSQLRTLFNQQGISQQQHMSSSSITSPPSPTTTPPESPAITVGPSSSSPLRTPSAAGGLSSSNSNSVRQVLLESSSRRGLDFHNHHANYSSLYHHGGNAGLVGESSHLGQYEADNQLQADDSDQESYV